MEGVISLISVALVLSVFVPSGKSTPGQVMRQI